MASFFTSFLVRVDDDAFSRLPIPFLSHSL